MWKTVLALLVTIIVIPILAFTMDESVTAFQKEILHNLVIVYLAAAFLCFLYKSLSLGLGVSVNSLVGPK